MHLPPRILAAASSVSMIALLLTGCDTRQFNEPLATLEVTTVTEGDVVDSDGYVLLIDGDEQSPVLANGLTIVDDLEPGVYQIGLGGIAPNCLLSGDAEVAVTLESSETAEVTFEVVCTDVGANLLFESDRGGSLDLYTIDFTTGIVRALTDAPGPDYGGRSSPDGTWIVFTGLREGNLEIYRMRPDGTAFTNLTKNAAADTEPAFSPDGSRIAFVSDRDGDEEIYVMNVDGSAVRRLTERIGAADTQPVWLDDSSIIFTSTTERSMLWVMSVTGGSERLLGLDARGGSYAAVSADGTRIAYAANEGGNLEIFVTNRDGSNPTRLTNHPANDVAPAFSPDGTRIAFASDRSGNGDVFLTSVDGAGEPLNLTNDVAFDFQPVFFPAAQ